jgi:hypothetical protein
VLWDFIWSWLFLKSFLTSTVPSAVIKCQFCYSSHFMSLSVISCHSYHFMSFMSFHVISCVSMSYHVISFVIGLFRQDFNKVGREGSGIRVKYVFLGLRRQLRRVTAQVYRMWIKSGLMFKEPCQECLKVQECHFEAYPPT